MIAVTDDRAAAGVDDLLAAAHRHIRAGLPWCTDQVVADLCRRAGDDPALLLAAASAAEQRLAHRRSLVLTVDVLRLAALACVVDP